MAPNGQVCVRSGMGSDTRGVCMSLEVCGTGGAVQLGGQAGCEEGTLGDHAATAAEHAVHVPCCRANVPDLLAATSTEAGSKAIVCATHTLARRRFWRTVCEEWEPGPLELGVRECRTPCGARSRVAVHRRV